MSDFPADDSPLIRQVKAFRQAIAKREADELRRLVDAYRTVNDATQRELTALLAKIEAANGEMTRGQLTTLRQYRQLIDETQKQLEQFRGFTRVELGTATKTSIAEGERAARVLTRLAAREGGIDAQIMRLNPRVIEQIVGFLDPGGPLYKRLDGMPKYTADAVAQMIIEGVGMGRNPKRIARDVTNALGMGLTDSLRMMRTAQLWSYREANRASYIANADVVRGWVWFAELDGDCCASCVAMHGTEHPLDEPLNDHHNGRCAAIPLVIGAPNSIDAGTAWFESQNEEVQKSILGASKWDAWREGKFDLASVSGVQVNDVYGPMRVERSLKELIGDE